MHRSEIGERDKARFDFAAFECIGQRFGGVMWARGMGGCQMMLASILVMALNAKRPAQWPGDEGD
jgi:hypothetical protein